MAVGGGLPGDFGLVQLIDRSNDRITWSSPRYADQVTSLAFTPDGQCLVAGSSDSTVKVFELDADSGKAAASLDLAGHSGPVLAVACSPDQRVVVTASADRSIKVWELPSGRLIRSFNHHTARVNCLAFRPRLMPSDQASPAAFCASGSDDLTVRVWQPEIGRMVRIVRQHGGAVFAVAYHPNGSVMFSAGKEGVVRVIDAQSDVIQREWKAHRDWIYSLVVSPAGDLLATGDWSGEIKLWNIATGTEMDVTGRINIR